MTGEAYDESEIIALVTEYYHLLFSLCYISADDIDFPPPEGRKVDEEFCQSLNLTPNVVSLMQHLPCPCDDGVMLTYELFSHDSFANSFVNNHLIKWGRDPEIGERSDFLRPTDIALTIMGDEGVYLVLDTSKNTLRLCEFNGPLDPEDEDGSDLQYDYDPNAASDDYTRFPIRNPLEFLRQCIENVRSLKWVPMHRYGSGEISAHPSTHANIKKILIETYGWPDNFQQAMWERDHERIYKEEEQRVRFERNGIGAIIRIDDPDERLTRPELNEQQENSRCSVS